ncbi:MAG TPA: dipeptide ABC transporter ATP-binding protein [Ktedonobacterales bacterium]|jgi:oligopeptide transport system ATP-binding protein
MEQEATLTDDQTLLEVKDLKVYFPVHGGLLGRTVAHVKAVDGVDLVVLRGETLGLVGESGCGKSTTGRAILQLIKPTAGTVRFKGQELTRLNPAQIRQQRANMQMIFQDPFGSLDPRFTVGEIIAEPLENFKHYSKEEARQRVEELLEVVGLNPKYVNRFPHEFSGGQRQRIGIARALALNPAFVVCDEPVSALDVSIQAQVLNLLEDLQERFGLTYLFIAHNLSVVKHISDRVAVMYLGRVVEVAERNQLYEQPLHPYTQALLSAIPVPNPEVEAQRQRIILEGDVPSPVNPPKGCTFHPRCWKAQQVCREQVPPLEKKEGAHLAACFFPGV